jgi:hypothetical protein
MPLDPIELYSCPLCGSAKSGMEWSEHTGVDGKEYICLDCAQGLNEDELYSFGGQDGQEI